jgi:RHS repeat-associated protein
VWSWDPADFGETAVNQKLSGTTFSYNQRFPGQYYDGATLKNYNYFRDYDPAVGGYLETDPIGLVGGLNPFAYVHGNPVTFSDPNALWNIIAGFGVSAVAVGIGGGESSFGGYFNWETGKCGGFFSIGGGTSGQSGNGYTAGVSLGIVTGAASNVGGPFFNFNLPIPGTMLSVTAYGNAAGDIVGGAIGIGPGVGWTMTTTDTTLYPR